MQNEIKIWSEVEIDSEIGTLIDVPESEQTYVLRGVIGEHAANIAMPLQEANPMVMLDQLIDFLKEKLKCNVS